MCKCKRIKLEDIQFFPGLENFDVTKPESFKMWLVRFKILVANRITEANLARSRNDQIDVNSKEMITYKLNCLYQALGPSGFEILKTVESELSKADRESFEAVTDALTAYFEPKKNVFYQRRVFMSRVQKANESNFQFIDAVRKLAHHIEVNDKDDKNVWILSVLMNGLRDRKQAERIQLLDNVNLG